MIKCKNPCPLDKFDGCCGVCPEKPACSDSCTRDPYTCEDAIKEAGDTELAAFKSAQLKTLDAISALISHKKAVEEQEADLKKQLYAAMEQFGIDKFESDVLILTRVQPTTAETLDGAKIKKNYPDVAKECTKVQKRAGYVKITLKECDK